MNSSSDEKAVGVVGIHSLRDRQRGVVETDLITVKESEWERLHAELTRTNQAIEDIAALHHDIGGICDVCADGGGPKYWPCPTARILSGLSEHQEAKCAALLERLHVLEAEAEANPDPRSLGDPLPRPLGPWPLLSPRTEA